MMFRQGCELTSLVDLLQVVLESFSVNHSTVTVSLASRNHPTYSRFRERTPVRNRTADRD